jgi:hypothetical protein
MKKIILSTVLLALLSVGCNQKNKQEESVIGETTENSSQLYACSMHPEITGKKGEECSICGMDLTEPVTQVEEPAAEDKTEVTSAPLSTSSFSVDEILNNYLKLKNALAKDDSEGAATAGKELYSTFKNVKSDKIEAKFKKYADIADDAKEHAEHIGDNSGKIDHQREHFAMLSKDVNDLIKIFGTDKKIYRDYCPMYDQGKSGYWISEFKDIKNPYYGSEMLTCGGITKTW